MKTLLEKIKTELSHEMTAGIWVLTYGHLMAEIQMKYCHRKDDEAEEMLRQYYEEREEILNHLNSKTFDFK